MMDARQAKAQVEQLMGRLDAVKGEISRAKHELERFKGLNQHVEAKDAADDLGRLESRKRLIEAELAKLKKFW